MSRIDDLIAKKCPSGVKYATLGEMGLFVRGNGLQKKDLKDSGFACIHYGQVHTQYGTQASITKSFVTNQLASRLRKAEPDNLIIATTSEDDEGVCKAMAWMGTSAVAVSGDCYVYRHSLNPLFVAYFFQTNSFREQKMRFITGTKVKRVSGKDLARIRLPVPSGEIQSEIVSILVGMEQLEAELETELEARRRQYDYYRNSLLSFDVKDGVTWSTLSDVAEIGTGSRNTIDGLSVGSYPFFVRSQEVRYMDSWDFDETAIITLSKVSMHFINVPTEYESLHLN
jgi:type I restriction enzyme S subunit